MSGERVKAKKKSAKKAAAASAPAPQRAKSEEFIIGNVRCFAEEQRVPIRPITLLVGENSTGKTTFLGGYRVLSQMLSSIKPMPNNYYSTAFNQPPFPMGKYRDIVRRPNAGEFCLGWAGEWSDEFAASGVSEVKISFREKDELPFLSKSVFSFRSGEKLEAVHQDKNGSTTLIFPDFRYEVGMRLSRMLFDIPTTFEDMLLMLWRQDAEKKRSGADCEGNKFEKFLQKNMGLAPPSSTVQSFWDKEEGTLMPGYLAPFAPMRSKPKRTYSILDDEPEHEGGDIPTMMFRMSLRNPEELKDLCRRIDAFGKVTGMFSNVRVVEHGSESGGDFHLELKVGGVESNIMDVGYGVSQIYPMLARIMRASQRGIQAAFLLQQPEVHLHPRAQAELGSFFVESVKKDGHTFLVETHSDFIVDRIRICMADGLIDPKDVALLYFEPQKSKDAVKIHPIELNSKGEPAENPPKGYRDFFLRETERMLGFRD